MCKPIPGYTYLPSKQPIRKEGDERKYKHGFRHKEGFFTSRSITSGDKAGALKLICMAPLFALRRVLPINEIIGSKNSASKEGDSPLNKGFYIDKNDGPLREMRGPAERGEQL